MAGETVVTLKLSDTDLRYLGYALGCYNTKLHVRADAFDLNGQPEDAHEHRCRACEVERLKVRIIQAFEKGRRKQ